MRMRKLRHCGRLAQSQALRRILRKVTDSGPFAGKMSRSCARFENRLHRFDERFTTQNARFCLCRHSTGLATPTRSKLPPSWRRCQGKPGVAVDRVTADLQTAFERRLHGTGFARWTKPLGGYFISVDVHEGCAARVVEMARHARAFIGRRFGGHAGRLYNTLPRQAR